MLLNFQTLARKVRNTCWFPFTIASPGNYVQRQVERIDIHFVNSNKNVNHLLIHCLERDRTVS